MKDKIEIKYRFLFAGIGFGLLFPIIGIWVELLGQNLSLTFKNIVEIHRINRLLLIIDLAPFVIGPIAYYLGIKQQKLEHVSFELDLKNQDQGEQLKMLNIILNKRNEDLEQMAYGTTHDLKSTLRGISSLITFVNEEKDPTEKINYYTLLTKRVDRMEALLDSMLHYLRIIQQTNKYSKFSLAEMADELSFKFRDQELSLKFIGFEGKVLLDKSKMTTILTELIQNSIKFSDKEKPETTIRSTNNGVNLHVTVEDNGPGIDPSFSEKIFKIYATLQRRDDLESIGIGLAIVKRFTEDLNGEIVLLPSSGAKFSLKFPL